jgi:hypothetical protein
MMMERSGADLRVNPSDSRPLSGTGLGETVPDQTESDDAPKPGVGAAEPGKKTAASLSAQTRDRIAMQLRTMYDTVASQPVPDRFAELIAKLDVADREK